MKVKSGKRNGNHTLVVREASLKGYRSELKLKRQGVGYTKMWGIAF